VVSSRARQISSVDIPVIDPEDPPVDPLDLDPTIDPDPPVDPTAQRAKEEQEEEERW
jgi:hypothetical protein